MFGERPWMGLAAERGTSEAGWTEPNIRATSATPAPAT
jgi:hypothetical protein